MVMMVFNTTVVSDPPLNVTVDSKSSRVVTISWMAGFNGNSAIQNYTVKISEGNQTFGEAVCQGSLPSSSCVVPSSSTSASLSNLFPWTTYYIRVFARNIVGTSDSSTVVSVTTDEEGTFCLFKIYHSLLFIMFYLNTERSYNIL